MLVTNFSIILKYFQAFFFGVTLKAFNDNLVPQYGDPYNGRRLFKNIQAKQKMVALCLLLFPKCFQSF